MGVTRNLALAFSRRKNERLVLLSTKGRPQSIIKTKLCIVKHRLFILIDMFLKHVLQSRVNNLRWLNISQYIINNNTHRDKCMFNKHDLGLFI